MWLHPPNRSIPGSVIISPKPPWLDLRGLKEPWAQRGLVCDQGWARVGGVFPETPAEPNISLSRRAGLRVLPSYQDASPGSVFVTLRRGEEGRGRKGKEGRAGRLLERAGWRRCLLTLSLSLSLSVVTTESEPFSIFKVSNPHWTTNWVAPLPFQVQRKTQRSLRQGLLSGTSRTAGTPAMSHRGDKGSADPRTRLPGRSGRKGRHRQGATRSPG